MRLKKHGAFLVQFVMDFVDEKIDRSNFDMDYSGYCIEHFPYFEAEHPRLAKKFANTIDLTYDTCSRMDDVRFLDAMADALDVFLHSDSDLI